MRMTVSILVIFREPLISTGEFTVRLEETVEFPWITQVPVLSQVALTCGGGRAQPPGAVGGGVGGGVVGRSEEDVGGEDVGCGEEDPTLLVDVGVGVVDCVTVGVDEADVCVGEADAVVLAGVVVTTGPGMAVMRYILLWMFAGVPVSYPPM